MKRLTKRSLPSVVYTSSPYLAWFSSPVPTQHQKQFWGVETTRQWPGRTGVKYTSPPLGCRDDRMWLTVARS